MNYQLPSITLILILLNVIISYKGFKDYLFFEKYKFNISALKNKEWVRMISSGFLHVDNSHLIFNMITLYFFAEPVLITFGTTSFLFIYLSSLLIGNYFAFRFHNNENNYNAVGASGAVTGVLYSAILIFPEMELFMFFIPIPIPGYLFAIGYLVYTVYGIKKQNDSIGHVTHFGGAVAGLILSLFMLPSLFYTSSYVFVILFTTIIVAGYVLFGNRKIKL
jgi:membrane associated rhomboid family serine protease